MGRYPINKHPDETGRTPQYACIANKLCIIVCLMPGDYAVLVKMHNVYYCTRCKLSRRKNRRARREQQRSEKQKYYKNFDNFENIIKYSAIYNAIRRASLGVSWKASVQRYLIKIIYKLYTVNRKLKTGQDTRKGFIEFDLNERGKMRHIKSVHFSERVVQKSLCMHALYPMIAKSLIYDNCASQTGKGTDFATNRVVKFLHNYYRKYGNEGYILKIDFKSYFDNIQHAPLKAMLRRFFADENILKLCDDFIDAFGDVGLGLGSETSQTNAILYTNKIDHWVKEVARCKYYCRYMDDSIIICNSKEKLNKVFQDMQPLFNEFGIVINRKKTIITKLSRGFTFLKTRFYLTETGKVIKKPCRKSITTERRKLKKQAKLLAVGTVTLDEIKQSYESWRGSMKKRNARRTVQSMNKLFKNLFSTKEEENDNTSNRTTETIQNL